MGRVKDDYIRLQELERTNAYDEIKSHLSRTWGESYKRMKQEELLMYDEDMYTQPMITVKVKQVYGKETIYPACYKAKLFADLLKQTTLTRENLKVIKQLGYKIDQELEEVAL